MTLLTVAVVALAATAQTVREDFKANIFLSASNYVDYDRQFTDAPLTPAPAGYEPYYMSHYGRHGSRWLIAEDSYTGVVEPLRKAKADGKLTAKGEETLEKLEQFLPTTVKRLGDLTTVGERQHHGIARRMVRNFPEIFCRPNVYIDARSTVVVRCILSMTAECEELAAANPTARFHNDVSKLFQTYLNSDREGIVKDLGRKGSQQLDAAKKQTDTSHLMQLLFNDQQWVAANLKAGDFMYRLFEVASNMQSHDTDIDLYPLFTADEVYQQWRMRNLRWYADYGPSPLTGSLVPYVQHKLLRNIIETADTVSQTQATLRFGHEVVVMPLAALLELGSCGVAISDTSKVEDVWRNYRIFPMASNIQLIFYRPIDGTKGDILVKAMLNEREVQLPIATDRYPYYKWAELRQYYLDKLDRFDALNRKHIEENNGNNESSL